jgi:PAS domain S-box-containing protein
METNLLFSEKFVREILSLLKNAVLITDTDGIIRFVCAETEAFLGYPHDELTGRSVEILFLQEDRKVLLPNIMKITRKKGSFHGEALLAAQSGQHQYSHISAHQLSLGSGSEDRLLWTIHDLSRIKDIEKNCQTLENLSVLGRMTEKVAQEIARHLLCLSGFTARLEGSLAEDHPLVPHLAPLKEDILSLESVLRQVEAFATLPAPDYRKEDLLDTLQLLVAEFQPMAADKGATLHLKSSARPSSTLIYMDPDLILYGLRNLLHMQTEALSPGSHLDIHLSEEDSSLLLEFECAHHASGIPSLNGSVSPFLAECGRNENLRLALIARIVEGHGGELVLQQHSARGRVVRIRFLRDRRQKARTQPF